jgi:hypothetical protein
MKMKIPAQDVQEDREEQEILQNSNYCDQQDFPHFPCGDESANK